MLIDGAGSGSGPTPPRDPIMEVLSTIAVGQRALLVGMQQILVREMAKLMASAPEPRSPADALHLSNLMLALSSCIDASAAHQRLMNGKAG